VNPAQQKKYFLAQGVAILGALLSPMFCWISGSGWGTLLGGVCTLAASALCILGKKTILVPRSLRPLVDGIPEGPEKIEVERATAVMMGIILGLLGLLLLVTSALLFWGPVLGPADTGAQ